MNRKVFLAVFALFIFAYILRVLFLPDLALTFGYDQARDAYVAQQIINGDFKILGPPSSTPGLYHGVFYYYLLAPAYALGGGSPIIVAYWIAALNSLAVFTVFYLTYLLVKKWGAALLAAFLYAISWESTQYATWLSNPTMGVWTVPLIYLGLWAWVGHRKWWGALVSALGLGLSVQANIFLAYQIPPIILWLWIGRKNIKRGDLIKFSTIFFILISSMLVSEIKFGFRGIGGVAQLFIAQDAIVASRSLGDFIVLYLNQLGRVFAYSSYPGNIGYGGVFVLVLIVLTLLSWSRKNPVAWQPFLATWLLSHITVASVGGVSTPFLLVGIGPAVSILLGIFLFKWWEEKRALFFVILGIILLANLGKIVKENPRGSTIFAIQKDMIISKQLPAIDYTYQEARGEPFSINTVTSPLWINTTWSYLYSWYGKEKNSYLPEWYGRDQIGQLGNNLVKRSDNTLLHFFIVEPMQGIPGQYLELEQGAEDKQSELVEERNFGEIRVQKRLKREMSDEE